VKVRMSVGERWRCQDRRRSRELTSTDRPNICVIWSITTLFRRMQILKSANSGRTIVMVLHVHHQQAHYKIARAFYLRSLLVVHMDTEGHHGYVRKSLKSWSCYSLSVQDTAAVLVITRRCYLDLVQSLRTLVIQCHSVLLECPCFCAAVHALLLKFPRLLLMSLSP
jgi:hypothetical protein